MIKGWSSPRLSRHCTLALLRWLPDTLLEARSFTFCRGLVRQTDGQGLSEVNGHAATYSDASLGGAVGPWRGKACASCGQRGRHLLLLLPTTLTLQPRPSRVCPTAEQAGPVHRTSGDTGLYWVPTVVFQFPSLALVGQFPGVQQVALSTGLGAASGSFARPSCLG